MHKRFEDQSQLRIYQIADIKVSTKLRGAFPKLVLALKDFFVNKEYNERVFAILEENLLAGKKKTGRPSMSLWQIFVLEQV